MNDEQQYIKEILEVKLEALAKLLGDKLDHFYAEVRKIEEGMQAHVGQNEEANMEFRESVRRLHSRIDLFENLKEEVRDLRVQVASEIKELQGRVTVAEAPKKLKPLELALSSVYKSAPWAIFFSLLWFFTSGAAGQFATFLVQHLPK